MKLKNGRKDCWAKAIALSVKMKSGIQMLMSGTKFGEQGNYAVSPEKEVVIIVDGRRMND